MSDRPTQRAVVRRRPDPVNRAIWWAVAGWSLGLLVSLGTGRLLEWMSDPGAGGLRIDAWVRAFFSMLALVPLAIVSWIAAAHARSGLVAFVIASLPIFAFQVASILASPISGDRVMPASGVVIMTLFGALTTPFWAGLVGLVGVLIWIGTSRWRGVIIEQNGSRCWSCGADVNAARASGRCASCATELTRDLVDPVSSQARRRRRAARARWIGACVIAALGMATFVRWMQLVLRARDSYAAEIAGLPDGGTLMSGAILAPNWTTPKGTAPWAIDAVGRVVTVPEEPTHAILVFFKSNPPAGLPPMQLRLVSGRDWDPGTPSIHVDLTSGQAAWVRDHGVPAALAARMVQSAKENGQVRANGVVSGVIQVDPGEFIPEK